MESTKFVLRNKGWRSISSDTWKRRLHAELQELQRIDNVSAEDRALQADLLDFIAAGGKDGRTQDEIDDFGVSRGNTTKK